MQKSIYMLLSAVILNFMTGCTANTTTSDRLNNQTSQVDQIIQQQAEKSEAQKQDKAEEGSSVCVSGVFDTYVDGPYTYCTLRNAIMENN